MKHPLRALAMIALSAALLGGCAMQPPPPPTGPSALIADTGRGGGNAGGAFFYVLEVDGQSQGPTSLTASRAASAGRGSFLAMVHVERRVHAGHVKLKLGGQFTHAAPIQNLFSKSASYAVEGDVEVDLKPDATYHVNGVLDAFRREVWLETEDGVRVGPIVTGPADDATQAAMAGAAYTCCNLHYEGDWISDHNASSLDFIPAGARIVVKDYGRHRADVLIDGRPMRIGHDFGRDQESKEQFVAKLITPQDPRLKIAQFSPGIQAAIKAGKLQTGMSKEQVIMAMGYPSTDRTPTLDKAQWTYWLDDTNEFVLYWGTDGSLQKVSAPDWVKDMVMFTESAP